MEVVTHPSNTRLLQAPEGWPQEAEPCGPLPITETEHNGVPWMLSFWKPSEEDIARLQAGEVLVVWVQGQPDRHPVIGLGRGTMDVAVMAAEPTPAELEDMAAAPVAAEPVDA